MMKQNKETNKMIIKKQLRGLNRFTAVKTSKLEVLTGICPQAIRGAINELRQVGCPICVSPNGYYWETNRKRVIRYAEQLRLKADGILKAVNGLLKLKKHL